MRYAKSIFVLSFAAAMLAGPQADAAAPPAMLVPGQMNVGTTGAFSYSIPIAAVPGTAGMAPALSLDYSSQGADGIVGLRWGLSGLPAMGRCSRTVVQDGVRGSINYDANDRFCLDGQRLILVSGTYGADASEYRTEIETFSKIIAYGTAGTGPSYFKVWTKSGRILELGNSTDSKILAVGTSTARAWLINRISDNKSNYLTVTYTNDTTNGQAYPTRIDYTGNTAASVSPYNSVQFSYTARSDITPTYQAGSLMQTTVLLTDVKTYQGTNVVGDYQLGYQAGSSTSHSRLTSVTLCDGSGACLAPTTFGWQGGGTGLPTMSTTANGLAQSGTLAPGEFTGDGLTDAAVDTATACDIFAGSAGGSYSSSGILANYELWEDDGGVFEHGWVTSQVPCFPAISLGQNGYVYFDFNGDAISDVSLTQNHTATTTYQHVLWNNGSGALTEVGQVQATAPTLVADFNGDGRSDLFAKLTLAGNYNLFYSNGDGTFGGGASYSTGIVYSAGDFDGDGCMDLLQQSAATHQIVYSCNPAVATTSVPYWSGAQITLGDFNGDGKTDILVTYTAAAGTLYLSTGTGLTATSFSVPTDWGKYTIVAGDWNGDGKADIALMAAGGSGKYTHGTAHSIWLSTGTGFIQQTTIANNNSADTTENPVTADWNNDGASDIWLQKPSGDTVYTFAYVPELMTAVYNGIGAGIAITYDRINKNGTFYSKTAATYPAQALDGPYYAVKEVDTSNGITGTYVRTFAYSGATGNVGAYLYAGANAGSGAYVYAGIRSAVAGGMALGFSQMTATDAQTGIVTTTNIRTDFPYAGRVSSQTRVLSGTTLSSVVNTWTATNPINTHINNVTLATSVVSGNDIDGSALPTTTTGYTYDTYGNPLTIEPALSDGSTRLITNTFTNDTVNWILGQLHTQTVNSYVTLPGLTRSFSFLHDAATGLVTRQIAEPSSGTLRLQHDIIYDAFGNPTSYSSVGPGLGTRATTAAYDAKGEFATSVTDALSHATGLVFSPAFGELTSQTDPNLLVATAGYDTFGRPTLATRPDGNKTVIAYAYCSGVNGGTASCPTYGAYLVTATPENSSGTQNGPSATTTYDMLNRVIASDTQGFSGATIRVATQYDASARVSQTSRPYFVSGGTAKWTAYTYDALGRVTLATFPDSSHTTYAYHGLSSSVTNDKGQVTTTVLNAHGLVASVTDNLGHATSYGYDLFDNLTSTTDQLGNVIVNTYDIRGRKTASADPDMGSWSYVYNPLSELTSQTDAKSQVTTLVYDVLERPTRRVETGLVSNWVYDTATTGIGQMTSACTGSGCTTPATSTYFRAHAYDSLGRPSTVTLTIGATAYTYTTTYNSDGRIDTVTYPSGFVAKYLYTSLGYLSQIKDNSSGTVYWTVNSRDAELHLTQGTAGSGVATTQGFDANTGNITSIQAGASSTVANFAYIWDTIGNLNSRSDTNGGYTEQFCYDGLNRLTDSAMGSSSTCTTGTNHKTVAYDAIGDITAKTGIGTYAYPASGSTSVQPHAVSAITGTVNGVVNPTYTYDANGNMTAGDGRTITPTAFNMAASVVQSGTTIALTYDSEHNRITQTLSGGSASTTTYLNDPTNGAMSEKFLTGGVTTWRDYIVSDNGLVAERFNTGGTIAVDYVIGDHLGSTGSVTGSTGTVTERNSFDAWGLRRNANGTDAASCNAISSAITRGFTGQESIDPACAINFNARLQDPSIARFMGADPFVSDPMDGQSFNRLSYVTNNPLNATDPSGYDIVCNNGVCRQVEPTTPVETVTVTGVPHYTEPLWEATGNYSPPGPGGLTEPDGSPMETVEVDSRRWPRQRIFLPPGFFLTATAAAAELQRDPNGKPGFCSLLPSGRTMGGQVSVGIGVAPVFGAEQLLNYDTGQLSGFGYTGAQAGLIGRASATGSMSYVWGNLGPGSSNYAGGFGTASYGPGALAVNATGSPSTGIGTLGVSGGPTWGVSVFSGGATGYSHPVNMGPWWSNMNTITTPSDILIMIARLPCH